MASAVATSLRTHFPSVRFGFMVGIGGGVPSKEHDVRLGDVVISAPYGTFGGVVQYDLGKAGPGKTFKRTGQLNAPPTQLLNALNSYEADRLLADEEEGEIAKLLQKFRPLERKGFTRDTCGPDKLYGGEYEHNEGEPNCDKCEETAIVTRPSRDSSFPQIHTGTIASGNQVIKDAAQRDTLSSELGGVLCFEMEAAGLMNTFPCLVFRGICDYCDTHKNNSWQSYAAATAAACAADFLLTIPPFAVRQIDSIAEALQDNTEALARIEQTQRESRHLDQKDRFYRWLAPPETSANLQDAMNLRQEGTGDWLLKSPDLLTWKDEDHSFLWMCGFSGCGKTVLSSTVIERMQGTISERQEGFAYFFFDFRESSKQAFSGMMKSLVMQLSLVNEKTWREALKLLESDEDKGQPRESSVEALFERLVQSIGQVYIVIDALDEAHPRQPVLNWLRQLLQKKIPNLHVLLTSRDEEDIRQGLSLAGVESKSILPLEDSLLSQDINIYIRQRLFHSSDFQRWSQSTDTLQMIQTRLEDKAQGMFRWAACQLDTLQECLDLEQMEVTLESLPLTLDETYKRMIEKIQHIHLAKAVALLQVLILSDRPVTLEEAVDIVATKVGKEKFEPNYRMPQASDVGRLCPGLLRITEAPEHWPPDSPEPSKQCMIGFAHYSVREFLTSRRLTESLAASFDEESVVTAVVKLSLSYWMQIDPIVKNLTKAMPWSRHAGYLWFQNARHAEKIDESVPNLILQLFNSKKLAKWHDMGIKYSDEPFNRSDCPKLVWHIHLAAAGGIDRCMEILLLGMVNVNDTSTGSGTALYTASSHGNDSTVMKLLSKGADVNVSGGLYGNALQAACVKGHISIVKALLERGAYVDARGGLHGFALHAASYAGHVQVVHELINHKANLDSEADQGRRALHVAVEQGHAQVTKVLIKSGSDINAQQSNGYTALTQACQQDDDSIVRLLLEKGANANFSACQRNATPLSAACLRNNESLVDVLFEYGADAACEVRGASCTGYWFNNPLTAASFEGNARIVRKLLERGARVDAELGQGLHPLHIACYVDHADIVELLIANGAKVNAASTFGSALHVAAFHGAADTLQVLLTRGADVNAKTKYPIMVLEQAFGPGYMNVYSGITTAAKYTPLQYAAESDRTEVVKMLLECTDLNSRSVLSTIMALEGNDEANDGGQNTLTPQRREAMLQILRKYRAEHAPDSLEDQLWLATTTGNAANFRSLLDHVQRADINTTCSAPLEAAAEMGNEAFVKAMIDAGVDVNTRGPNTSALIAACQGGHVQVARMLLEAGADVDHAEPDRTALCVAAEGDETGRLLTLLLDAGARVDKMSRHGTALHYAAAKGNARNVRLLVDAGADVRAPTRLGTCLHSAAFGGDAECGEHLIGEGVPVDAAGRAGTALQIAEREECYEFKDMLLRHGATIDDESYEEEVDYGWDAEGSLSDLVGDEEE